MLTKNINILKVLNSNIPPGAILTDHANLLLLRLPSFTTAASMTLTLASRFPHLRGDRFQFQFQHRFQFKLNSSTLRRSVLFSVLGFFWFVFESSAKKKVVFRVISHICYKLKWWYFEPFFQLTSLRERQPFSFRNCFIFFFRQLGAGNIVIIKFSYLWISLSNLSWILCFPKIVLS